ncbi:rRNA maturation RNase YbeY [Microgenomates group bacterium RIFCSPLOWO2_01_FULL_47_10]|nr:MAG: rRNA maturation RNase YbeY [Microgenomates group bacterium RIFCSPLOWO2_01_FULL_47_10]
MSIKVFVKADGKYPVDRKRIRTRVGLVLAEKRISGPVQVSVWIVGDRKMTYYNENFKKHAGTTDVLSFPYSELDPESRTPGFIMSPELGLILGDIIISYPEARKRAMKRGKMVDEVVDFLVEHGLRHLTGEHHD